MLKLFWFNCIQWLRVINFYHVLRRGLFLGHTVVLVLLLNVSVLSFYCF